MDLSGRIMSVLATWTEANLTKKYIFPRVLSKPGRLGKEKPSKSFILFLR
jgi:hypothetical protein